MGAKRRPDFRVKFVRWRGFTCRRKFLKKWTRTFGRFFSGDFLGDNWSFGGGGRTVGSLGVGATMEGVSMRFSVKLTGGGNAEIG